MPEADIPPDLDRALREALGPGEALAWSGRPRPSRLARRSIPLACFGAFWLALAFSWRAIGRSVANGPRAEEALDLLLPIFGVPFALAGLAMLVAPIRADLRARRTAYAVSDRRLLMVEPRVGGGHRVASATAKDVETLVVRERKDGSGDLGFGKVHSRDPRGWNGREFLGVDQVRAVESLIRATLLAGRPSGRRTSRTNSGGQP